MYASKLTISPDTMAQAEKPLTSKEIGRLRYERLCELDASGELQRACYREDVLRMLGLEYNQTNAGWISRYIINGYLTETVTNHGWEYHIGYNKPNFEPFAGKHRNMRHAAKPEVKVVPELSKDNVTVATADTIKITKGDITIEMPYHLEIIKQLLNIKD